MAGDHVAVSGGPAVSRRRDLRRLLATSRLVHVIALALPFVAVVVASGGLRHPFQVYQSYDELHHFYGAVERVAAAWPRLVTNGYESWSGPLVYWLLAGLARPLGSSLEATRVVVAVLSWATCVAAYELFRDGLKARPAVALAFAFMLAVSPFFFGESFYVLTDNPTWLFVVLSLAGLVAWVRTPQLWRFALAVVCACVASLMRQVAVWLYVPAVVAVAAAACTPRRKLVALAFVAAGLVPLAALLVSWGGLLPSGSAQTEPASARLHSVLLSLAVVGVWGVLLAPAAEVRELPSRLGRRGLAAVLAAIVLGVVAVAIGGMGELGGRDPYGIGLLSPLLDAWPGVGGVSIVWWLCVPAGLAVLAALALTRTREPVDRLFVAALLAVVLSTAANTVWFQRYVDFAVLLSLLALVAAGGRPVGRVDILRWAAVVAVSVAWTLRVALA